VLSGNEDTKGQNKGKRLIVADPRGDEKMEEKIRKATSAGTLPVGDLRIPCYVLEDGTRVISQRGMQATIGMSTSGGTGGAHRTAQLVTRLEGKASQDNSLSVRMTSPIVFTPPKGGNLGYGYEATSLIDLCELILKCRDNDTLTGQQGKYATYADIVIRAFAKVGIIAVIDEVTGHQFQRPHDELEKILAAYVLPEHRPYVSSIPREFTRELYRVWDGIHPLSAALVTLGN
jgi:hypothetical protein